MLTSFMYQHQGTPAHASCMCFSSTFVLPLPLTFLLFPLETNTFSLLCAAQPPRAEDLLPMYFIEKKEAQGTEPSRAHHHIIPPHQSVLWMVLSDDHAHPQAPLPLRTRSLWLTRGPAPAVLPSLLRGVHIIPISSSGGWAVFCLSPFPAWPRSLSITAPLPTHLLPICMLSLQCLPLYSLLNPTVRTCPQDAGRTAPRDVHLSLPSPITSVLFFPDPLAACGTPDLPCPFPLVSLLLPALRPPFWCYCWVLLISLAAAHCGVPHLRP